MANLGSKSGRSSGPSKSFSSSRSSSSSRSVSRPSVKSSSSSSRSVSRPSHSTPTRSSFGHSTPTKSSIGHSTPARSPIGHTSAVKSSVSKTRVSSVSPVTKASPMVKKPVSVTPSKAAPVNKSFGSANHSVKQGSTFGSMFKSMFGASSTANTVKRPAVGSSPKSVVTPKAVVPPKPITRPNPVSTPKPVVTPKVNPTKAVAAGVATAGAVTAGAIAANKIAGKSRASRVPKSEPLRMNSIFSGLSLLDDNYMHGSPMPYYGGIYADQYYGDQGYYNESMNSKEYQESVLLSRIACCLYVAYADNLIAESEKANLDFMINSCLKSKKVSTNFKNNVRELISTRVTSFIQAQSYFQAVDPQDLVPLISLAEDMADTDGAISNEESKAVIKIRDYVSNVTGCDFNNGSFDEAKYEYDLLLAKLALCCYVAKADGNFSEDEKADVTMLVNQLLNDGEVTGEFEEVVNSIIDNEDPSFVFTQQFLDPINDEDLIPLISAVEEISNMDGQITIEETKAVNTFKVYVSNRTGENYVIELNDNDLVCPGCAAKMDIMAGNVLQCPYCGMQKTVNND